MCYFANSNAGARTAGDYASTVAFDKQGIGSGKVRQTVIEHSLEFWPRVEDDSYSSNDLVVGRTDRCGIYIGGEVGIKICWLKR